MILGLTLVMLPFAAPTRARDGGTELDLRTKVEAALADGPTAEELETLADEGLRLAAAATSRSQLWNALGLVADLCQAGPRVETRAVRERALELLARHDSDTRRWSSLVTQRFLPPFTGIPREAWAEELAEYDRTLDALYAAANDDRVRAELLCAKAFARVFLERRQDWLGAARRAEALELLGELELRFGALPVPGAAEPELETVGRRARQHAYELEHLGFGAPAPPTAGVDLEGRPLDLADHRGQVVVLDFWTSFCQPCLALVPSARELLDELADERVVYLGVCGDTDRAAGRSTAQRVGMLWRNLWDGPLGTEGPASTAWNVAAEGWPAVFVIDAEGRIRGKLFGEERVEAELEPAVRALLEKR